MIRRLIVVAALFAALVGTSWLVSSADPMPGTDRARRTVKKVCTVGVLGNVHLDTINCVGARQIVSWVRFASANSCTLATFLFSTNDSTFTAGGITTTTDSLSSKIGTNNLGPKWIEAYGQDAANVGALARIPYKSALLRVTRRSTGNKGDSATVTNLDTAYVTTFVYY